MADPFIFPKGREFILQNGLSSADVRLVMVDEADHADNDSDVFLDDITSGAIVATSGALASKTYTNGAFSSAVATIGATSGDPTEKTYLYVHTGDPETATLIARLNCTFMYNGSSVNVTPHANGWFKFNGNDA